MPAYATFRSRTFVATALSILLASPPAFADEAPPEVLEAPFIAGLDRSSWYWSLQPQLLGGPLPNPQDPDTLPVSVVAGARDRAAALRFELESRGVPPFSTVEAARLEIEEGGGDDEQPAIDPDLATLEACPVIEPWGSGAAEPGEQAPLIDEADCVAGVRADGVWTFDLTSAAGPWADDAGANQGVLVRAGEVTGDPLDTWQVNLNRVTATLTMSYRPPPPTDGYPAAGDTTGITPQTIRVGLHASMTGMVPIPPAAIRDGSERYWKSGDAGGPVTIAGREVEVFMQDDKASPSGAVSACRDLIEDFGVFLLLGFSAAEPSASCAQVAAQYGVPYVALGTGEAPFRSLRNLFAVSTTFPHQSRLLADYVQEIATVDPERVAVVATDRPLFDGAVGAFAARFPGATVLRPSKAEAGNAYAADLCSGPEALFDVVYVLTSPLFFLELERSAGCGLQYVGVGMTMGLDVVADSGCATGAGSMEGARFFSPAPAVADAGAHEAAFLEAGGEGDIEWLLWGLSKQLHVMLEVAGAEPDRRGFVDAAEKLTATTGIFPPVSFTRDDHFGARQVHILRATCDEEGGRFVTERAFWDGSEVGSSARTA